MKQRDHALKLALRSKTEHEKHLFTTLRNKVVKELRKAKASFFLLRLLVKQKEILKKYGRI